MKKLREVLFLHILKDPIGFSNKSKILIEGKANPPIDLKLQNEMQQKEAEKHELEKIGEKVEHEISADTELKGLADQIKIEVTKEGLRIELTDSENDIFFEIGTSNLKDKAVKLLEKIGKEIGKLPNKIIVEGHTDSRQFLIMLGLDLPILN